MEWLAKLIKEKQKLMQIAKKGHTGKLKVGQISNFTQLDKHLQNIPSFIGLKSFRHYSKVVHWLGNEQKSMVKQLIAAAILLLIQDASQTIHCICVIFNFIMLAQYPLHKNKILSYIDNALYRLHKTKIAFENYCSINAKLFWLTFNYPNFHVMTHFVKCIQDYGSAIKYDIAYSKAVYKYFLRPFIDKPIRKSMSCRF